MLNEAAACLKTVWRHGDLIERLNILYLLAIVPGVLIGSAAYLASI